MRSDIVPVAVFRTTSYPTGRTPVRAVRPQRQCGIRTQSPDEVAMVVDGQRLECATSQGAWT